MTGLNSILPALTALCLTVLFSGCSQSPAPVAVPNNVTTVTGGYPFALQVKKSMARDAHLTCVLVDLDRSHDRFQVQNITYGFASTNGHGRVFAIEVDNLTRQAFGAVDAPEIPRNPFIPATTFPPLDLANVRKEISDALEIAQTNGLAEFGALAPGKSGNVSLRLGTEEAGAVWRITGDGWDEKGPIADLSIVIDAKTGKVLDHTLQKAVNRR